jgi:hypothetical protein
MAKTTREDTDRSGHGFLAPNVARLHRAVAAATLTGALALAGAFATRGVRPRLARGLFVAVALSTAVGLVRLRAVRARHRLLRELCRGARAVDARPEVPTDVPGTWIAFTLDDETERYVRVARVTRPSLTVEPTRSGAHPVGSYREASPSDRSLDDLLVFVPDVSDSKVVAVNLPRRGLVLGRVSPRIEPPPPVQRRTIIVAAVVTSGAIVLFGSIGVAVYAHRRPAPRTEAPAPASTPRGVSSAFEREVRERVAAARAEAAEVGRARTEAFRHREQYILDPAGTPCDVDLLPPSVAADGAHDERASLDFYFEGHVLTDTTVARGGPGERVRGAVEADLERSIARVDAEFARGYAPEHIRVDVESLRLRRLDRDLTLWIDTEEPAGHPERLAGMLYLWSYETGALRCAARVDEVAASGAAAPRPGSDAGPTASDWAGIFGNPYTPRTPLERAAVLRGARHMVRLVRVPSSPLAHDAGLRPRRSR